MQLVATKYTFWAGSHKGDGVAHITVYKQGSTDIEIDPPKFIGQVEAERWSNFLGELSEIAADLDAGPP